MSNNIKYYTIEFDDTDYAPLTAPCGSALAEILTPENSPIAFGCCSGMCGACLSEVEDIDQSLPVSSDHERETLELFGQTSPRARLVCQLHLTGNLRMRVLADQLTHSEA